MMGFFEDTLSIHADVLPKKVDVLVATSIGLSKDLKKVSSSGVLLSQKLQRLYGSRISKEVLFLGGGVHQKVLSESQALANETSIKHYLLEEKSLTTLDAAKAFARLSRRNAWNSAVVVSQQWHARRVKYLLKKKCPWMRIYMVPSKSDYSDHDQWRLNNFFTFALWDTLAFILDWLRT